MMPLLFAKAAAVLSVIYAGVNAYQATARFAEVRDKAKLFAAIAAVPGAPARLRVVRALFYLAAPLAYLWTLLAAGLPAAFLAGAGAKFWISSFVGLRSEARILRGKAYRRRDHRVARLDALANIALACGAIWWILKLWT